MEKQKIEKEAKLLQKLKEKEKKEEQRRLAREKRLEQKEKEKQQRAKSQMERRKKVEEQRKANNLNKSVELNHKKNKQKGSDEEDDEEEDEENKEKKSLAKSKNNIRNINTPNKKTSEKNKISNTVTKGKHDQIVAKDKNNKQATKTLNVIKTKNSYNFKKPNEKLFLNTLANSKSNNMNNFKKELNKNKDYPYTKTVDYVKDGKSGLVLLRRNYDSNPDLELYKQLDEEIEKEKSEKEEKKTQVNDSDDEEDEKEEDLYNSKQFSTNKNLDYASFRSKKMNLLLTGKKITNQIKENQEAQYRTDFQKSLNPYSTHWASKFLKNGYNSGFCFSEFQGGIPVLRVKKLKQLPPIVKNDTNIKNTTGGRYDNEKNYNIINNNEDEEESKVKENEESKTINIENSTQRKNMLDPIKKKEGSDKYSENSEKKSEKTAEKDDED